MLDLPEPWQVVPHAMEALRPGGILVAYCPSIIQVSQLREALATKAWNGTRTLEVLHRGWYVEGAAVRPDHRMVAHTGFLTVDPLPRLSRVRGAGRERAARRPLVRAAPTSSAIRAVASAHGSMKMHSPGHSSADSMTASSWLSGMLAMPSAPCGLPLAVA